MKKLLSILLAVLILFSLTSCFMNEEENQNVDTQVEQNEQENVQDEDSHKRISRFQKNYWEVLQ